MQHSFPSIVTGGFTKTLKYMSIIGLTLCWGLCVMTDRIRSVWLYHSYSYEIGAYSLPIRFGILLFGTMILSGIFILIPNHKLKGLGYIGRNTMPIYLLHGFVVRWIDHCKIVYFLKIDVGLSIIFALILVIILSSAPVLNIMNKISRIPDGLTVRRS